MSLDVPNPGPGAGPGVGSADGDETKPLADGAKGSSMLPPPDSKSNSNDVRMDEAPAVHAGADAGGPGAGAKSDADNSAVLDAVAVNSENAAANIDHGGTVNGSSNNAAPMTNGVVSGSS